MNSKRGGKCLMGGVRLVLTVSLLLAASVPALAVPMVTARSPAANATWVSEYAPVTATFSEAMNPATITDHSFLLEKNVGVVAVAAGVGNSWSEWEPTVALKSDGSVVVWGSDVPVPAGLSNVVAVAAGGRQMVALKGDGTVVAWGDDFYGQTTVPPGLSSVVAIAAAESHTVALKRDGSVVAWGDNYYGQTTVPAGLNNVTAIAAGSRHTVSLKGDGTVVAWGNNEFGQTTVPAGLSDVTAIAAGEVHTVALKRDGSVVVWGNHSPVPAGLNDVTAIAAGEGTVALKRDGTVVIFGSGCESNVPSGLSGVVAINSRGKHVVALKADGSITEWWVCSHEPGYWLHSPTGLNAVVSVAAAGEYQYSAYTLAVKNDGTVAGWGANMFSYFSPPANLKDVAAVSASRTHAVALKKDGTVANVDSYAADPTQMQVPAGVSGVVTVAAGLGYTLALKSNGTVVGWGDPTSALANLPANLNGVVAIAAGEFTALAVKNNGTVVTWGDYGSKVYSGLGDIVAASVDGYGGVITLLRRDGSLVRVELFTGQLSPVTGIANVIAIAGNYFGELALKGDGTVIDLYGTTNMPAGLNNVVAIAVGSEHAVALKGDGTVVAWGDNLWGQTTVPTEPDLGFAPVAGTVSYQGSTRAATFTPAEPLDPQAVYRVSVFGRSLAGAPVMGSSSWQFSTGESVARSLVTPKAGTHGRITPAIGRWAINGTATGFQVTPDPGYVIDTVTGCGGALVGTTYTTGPISQVCTVTATFRPQPTAAAPAALAVPAADNDGNYVVTWGASATAGATYELQEATNSLFTIGLRTAYAGTAQATTLIGRSQNSTYYYRVRAKKTGYTSSPWRNGNNGCAVPGSAPAGTPASLTVPTADADGAYTLNWGGSATAGATYVLHETTDPTFATGERLAYSGPNRSVTILGRAQNRTYYYRLKAVKAGYTDSAWRVASYGCAVPGVSMVGMPAAITVPAADADGAYLVTWGTSTTAGVTYELQEATSSTFSAARTAYSGTALSASITGRSQNVTYYYRVRAVKGGFKDSGYRYAANSCALPGTATAGVPASITVPAADADGAYLVSWGASATAGVIYELQEATASNFSTGLRLASRGTATTFNVTGRTPGTTCYYRVRAVKGGLKDSGYRTTGNGCQIGP